MKKGAVFAWMAVGIVLAVVGLCYLKSPAAAEDTMAALPYVCIGVGCGIFGHGLGEIISNRALRNAPDLVKQIEIEKNDERNVEIANRAKGKAYDAMIYIFGALLVSFGLMKLPTYVILMLAFAYLLVVGISIYYRCKYEKEL